MSSTATHVNARLRLIDGSASNDVVARDRWVLAYQRSANFLWNDRPWGFKLKTVPGYTYTPRWLNPVSPTADNPPPAEFGSFESRGAGVYSVGIRRWLPPASDIGELKIALHGTQRTSQPINYNTSYGVDQGANGETIQLFPELSTPASLLLVFLRRAPRCIHTPAMGETDEIGWIPERWHDLLDQGAEWLNAHAIASAQEDTEKAFMKLGLDQMRERENWGQQGINRIVGFMPHRRNR